MNLLSEGPTKAKANVLTSPCHRGTGGLPLTGLQETSLSFQDIEDLLASGNIDIYKAR